MAAPTTRHLVEMLPTAAAAAAATAALKVALQAVNRASTT